MTGFWYFATPYTNYPEGIDMAYSESCTYAAVLIKKGWHLYCPIAMCHPIAIYGHIDPVDWVLWMKLQEPFVALAKGLIVCRMVGWDVSKGVALEIKAFERGRRPVLYSSPGDEPILPPNYSK